MLAEADRCHEMGPTLFVADWLDAIFIHFRLSGAALQPFVPFPLEEREGSAWVSLVAFTMDGMRAPAFGPLASVGLRLFTPCRFLNLRTYVEVDGEPGIYFLREWISNALSVPLGPVSLGLPYHAGRLEYAHRAEGGLMRGSVVAQGGAALAYEAKFTEEIARPAPPGSLDEFLVERYTAFTSWWSLRRSFRIRHSPWESRPVELRMTDRSLLESAGSWTKSLELSHATHTEGVHAVQIGYPGKV